MKRILIVIAMMLGLISPTTAATLTGSDIVVRAPWVDARSYNGGALTSATLQAAADAIQAGGVRKTLYVPAGFVVSTTVTFGSMVHVRPEPGAFTKSGSGALVWSSGATLDAGPYKIFTNFTYSDIAGLGEFKPEWASTADTTGVQFAMNYVALRGGKVVFQKRSYTITSALTMVSTDTTAARHEKVMIIEGNGATLDFSTGTWVADYSAGNQINLLNFGTIVNSDAPTLEEPDPQANPKGIIESGLSAIRNLRIVGNETAPPTVPDGIIKPTTGTVGLRFQLAHDVQLDNVYVISTTVGVETKDSWGIDAGTVKVKKCWIGLKIGGGSTYATWRNFAAMGCAYSIVMQSSLQSASPFYGAFAAITQQYFVNPRTEDTWYAWVVYAHDADIKGIHINGGYVEDVQRDWAVIGMAFTTMSSNIYNPVTPTDPSPSKVDRMEILNLGKIAFGGGYYAIRTYQATAAPEESIIHSKFILPALASDVKGTFKSSSLEFLGSGSISGGADVGATGSTTITDDLSGVVRKIMTKTGLTDNVATPAFKITTPSLTSNNGGAYSVHVHVLVSNLALMGTSSVSAKSFEANFVHVINDAGTVASSSSVTEVVETASATISAPSRDIGAVTMTVAEGASKWITNVLFQVDVTGVDSSTAEVTIAVEVVYKGFTEAPLVEVL